MRETMKINPPSHSAIESSTKLKFIEPGFNVDVLKYLKEKVQGMSPQRVAVLLLEEISIKKEANYNVRRDCVDGVCNINGNRKRNFATEAHFFMVRGLFDNYKYAFSYNLSKNNMK